MASTVSFCCCFDGNWRCSLDRRNFYAGLLRGNAFISFFCRELCLFFSILRDSVTPAGAVRSGIYWHNFKPTTVLPQFKVKLDLWCWCMTGPPLSLCWVSQEQSSALLNLQRIQLLLGCESLATGFTSQTKPNQGAEESRMGWNSVNWAWTEDS